MKDITDKLITHSDDGVKLKKIETDEPKREEDLCGFFGCKNKFDADTWESIIFHSCKEGSVHSSICGECYNKIFEDEW